MTELTGQNLENKEIELTPEVDDKKEADKFKAKLIDFMLDNTDFGDPDNVDNLVGLFADLKKADGNLSNDSELSPEDLARLTPD